MIEVGIRPESGKVVDTNDDTGISGLLVKAAWRSCASLEADRFKSATIAQLQGVLHLGSHRHIAPVDQQDWMQGPILGVDA